MNTHCLYCLVSLEKVHMTYEWTMLVKVYFYIITTAHYYAKLPALPSGLKPCGILTVAIIAGRRPFFPKPSEGQRLSAATQKVCLNLKQLNRCQIKEGSQHVNFHLLTLITSNEV